MGLGRRADNRLTPSVAVDRVLPQAGFRIVVCGGTSEISGTPPSFVETFRRTCAAARTLATPLESAVANLAGAMGRPVWVCPYRSRLALGCWRGASDRGIPLPGFSVSGPLASGQR
jgi:hypothetical protein